MLSIVGLVVHITDDYLAGILILRSNSVCHSPALAKFCLSTGTNWNCLANAGLSWCQVDPGVNIVPKQGKVGISMALALNRICQHFQASAGIHGVLLLAPLSNT